MKKLYKDGELVGEAEKIIKTKDSIYSEGKGDSFAIKGIKDFSKFELEEGQEFDKMDTDRIEDAIDDLWQSHLESEGLI